METRSHPRPRLGLALSGGGFRASLFHLGVLRRLAELDLLRHISVLSTVSGGSILGALYYLRLKRAIECAPRVSYVEVIERVAGDLRTGIGKDLRNRLFSNVFCNLAVWCLGKSLGGRMARLYTRHIFRNAIRDAFPDHPTWQTDGVPLMEARIEFNTAANKWTRNLPSSTEQRNELTADIEKYNTVAPDRVPKFVLNSTCLNTSSEFRFSISEISDPVLGSLRFDEIELVAAYRLILIRLQLLYRPRQSSIRFPERKAGFLIADEVFRESVSAHGDQERLKHGVIPKETTSKHLVWWYAASYLDYVTSKGGDSGWPDQRERFVGRAEQLGSLVTFLLHDESDILKLYSAPASHLRNAKVAAWHLLTWPPGIETRGGLTREEHSGQFWRSVRDIDVVIAQKLMEWRGNADANNGLSNIRPGRDWDVLAFFYDLYFFRTASEFNPDRKRLSRLTLSDAVAASANFPPVFPPFEIEGIFDPERIQRLALTDGGVYDNQGITALLDEGCTHIIASDAGGIPALERAPASCRLGMMIRIIEVLMVNLRDWQLRHLKSEREATDLASSVATAPLRERHNVREVALFHMASDPNDALPLGPTVNPHKCAEQITRLRTDLDLFNRAEQDALIYQGYQLSDRFVRKYLRELPMMNVVPDVNAALGVTTYSPKIERLRPILAAGAHRFFRIGTLYPWLKRTIITVGLGIVLAITSQYSISNLVHIAAASIWKCVRFPFFQEGSVFGRVLDNKGGVIEFLWKILQEPIVSLVMFTIMMVLIVKEIYMGTLIRTLIGTDYGYVTEREVSRDMSAALFRARAVRLIVRNLWWFIGLLPLYIASIIALMAAVLMITVGNVWSRIGRYPAPSDEEI